MIQTKDDIGWTVRFWKAWTDKLNMSSLSFIVRLNFGTVIGGSMCNWKSRTTKLPCWSTCVFYECENNYTITQLLRRTILMKPCYWTISNVRCWRDFQSTHEIPVNNVAISCRIYSFIRSMWNPAQQILLRSRSKNPGLYYKPYITNRTTKIVINRMF